MRGYRILYYVSSQCLCRNNFKGFYRNNFKKDKFLKERKKEKNRKANFQKN